MPTSTSSSLATSGWRHGGRRALWSRDIEVPERHRRRPDDVGAALDLAVGAVRGVGGPDIAPTLDWEGTEGEEVLPGVSMVTTSGDLGLDGGDDPVELGVAVGGSGCAKDRAILLAAAMSALALVTLSSTLRMKCNRQRCQAAPMKTLTMAYFRSRW